MKIAKTVLQALLIAQFAFFGISKVIGSAEMVETFTAFGAPSWFMVLTGVIELTAVVCFAYGFVNKQAVAYGSFLIAGLTVGAVILHTFVEGNIGNAVPPLIVFMQNALVYWLHNRAASDAPVAALA